MNYVQGFTFNCDCRRVCAATLDTDLHEWEERKQFYSLGLAKVVMVWVTCELMRGRGVRSMAECRAGRG